MQPEMGRYVSMALGVIFHRPPDISASRAQVFLKGNCDALRRLDGLPPGRSPVRSHDIARRHTLSAGAEPCVTVSTDVRLVNSKDLTPLPRYLPFLLLSSLTPYPANGRPGTRGTKILAASVEHYLAAYRIAPEKWNE